MITQEAYFGGSQSTSATSVSLTMASPRLLRLSGAAGAVTVTLPSIEHHQIKPGSYGGRWWVVINDSGQTATVRQPNAASLIVLADGEAAYVTLARESATTPWAAVKRVLGGPRAVSLSTRAGAIEAPETPDTFTVDSLHCFVGQDCELANAQPLDGEDDRPICIVPMFLNPCETAQNEAREAVRGADCIMPDRIVVRFGDDWTPDPLHALAGTTLSDEAMAALVAEGNPHLLEYDEDAKLTNAISRNPYHARMSPSGPFGWSMGSNFRCVKHFWSKRITYTVGVAETEHHIDIVFHVEHTALDEPTLTANGGSEGGETYDGEGAYGALFVLSVFCDELEPDFEDDDNHTPTGGSSAVTFQRHDPLVWGNAPGVSGGDDDDKFAHPQLLAIAVLPTTFHDPCRFLWIPLLDRFALRNREWAYRRANCAPWITDPDRDLPNLCTGCTSGQGSLANTVFFDGDTTHTLAAMSTGGDCPVSRPTERLCWENGLGQGRTYLKPGRPGWDEEIGELTTGELSASISLCIDFRGDWPDFPMQCCDGHPAQPFLGVGGTHRCIRTNEAEEDTACCILVTDAFAYWYQTCVKTKNVFGDQVGGECEIVDVDCTQSGKFYTGRVMTLYDYALGYVGAEVSGREMSWRRYLIDPRSELWSYTYDSGDVSDFDQDIGTWNFGPTTISTTGYNAGKNIKALLRYNPTRGANDGDWRDAEITVDFTNATNTSHMVGMRATEDGSDNASGIFFIIEPTGTDVGTARISRFVDDVEEVLSEVVNIVLDSDVVGVLFYLRGYDLRVTWQVAGHPGETLEVNFCSPEDGGAPAIGTLHNSAAAQFEMLTIDDLSYAWLALRASLGPESISVDEAHLELLYGYGQCDFETQGCCGDCCSPACCNCTYIFETLYSGLTASWSGPGDLLGLPDPTNPTYLGGPFWRTDCFGDWCPPATWYCGDCPEPFPAVNFALPKRCWPEDSDIDDDTEPGICKGLTYWVYSELTCD